MERGGMPRLSLKQWRELLSSNILVVRKAPPWTGEPLLMPEGTREGLEKAIALSRSLAGVKGTAIDPATHELLPRKALLQKYHRLLLGGVSDGNTS